MRIVQSGDELDSVTLDGLDLSGRRVADLSVLDCNWTRPLLDGAILEGGRFVDSAISDTVAVGVRLGGTTWRDCQLRSLRIGALDLSAAHLLRCSLADGKVDYLNLTGATLREVTLTRLVVTELSLSGVTAQTVRFIDCQIGVLELHATRLRDVDLSESRITEAVRGLDAARGLVISEQQMLDLAPAMAAHLGLRVV